MSEIWSSAALIEVLADEGTFRRWDQPAESHEAKAGYRAELDAAASGSGVDESVITGELRINGHRVAVIVSEFGFLGGSVGQSAARRVIAAARRASAEQLPILASPASGGTRMQEGTPAFVAMIDIASAIDEHKMAGLAYITYLRHPTTGGVLAAWGSVGQITFAQPGALIGLIGPRVQRLVTGSQPPADSQRAESALAAGFVDAVVEPKQLRDRLARVLRLLTRASTATDPIEHRDSTTRGRPIDGWAAVLASRRQQRPGARDLLTALGDGAIAIGGSERPGAAIVLALARLGAETCVVIAQDRAAEQSGARPGVDDLELVARGVALAGEWRLPVVTIVDTAGVAMGAAPEPPGLAAAVSKAMIALLRAPVPVVSLLLGEGGGAAALALFPADRRVAAENSWLAAMPPEAASALIHHDVGRADEVASQQRIGAEQLRRAGIVDVVVPERPDAAAECDSFCQRVLRVLALEVGTARISPPARRRTGAWS